MNKLIERIKTERDELQNRLAKLNDFMDIRFKECRFLELSPANRILLKRQKEVMEEYSDILNCRIELLESQEETK